ncbi:MAG TPA: class I SAM-dependent methyltransferase [Nitrospirota bacterium]|nr:class I SAM-dependent methyltransferase [Nitrospirota bacterium]
MGSLRNDVKDILSKITADFGGGCGLSKASLMAYLIKRYKLKITVDIGVYRGRSLFPQALAHSRFSGGIVYGVDPWDKSEAMEYDNKKLKAEIENFVTTTDFQKVYEEVESFRRTYHFEHYCRLLREPSQDAINYFLENDVYFDLIHIDGNHDTQRVMDDVRLYLPRLNNNGFVIIDDISWDSVKPAYAALHSTMSLIFERPGQDYAVFWKNSSRFENIVLKFILKFVGRE